MCGINGFNFVGEQQVELMNRMIKHRGPDGEGIFIDSKVSLGHVRLSILDLSEAGKQPMAYSHENKTAIIVFNGEVYNFSEIREILERKGYKFSSRTDTEVMLASYLEWGYDCVKHFNGMWAFVIYDPARRIFFCSRDRLGVKPFYYFFDKKRFIFSSELKGILAHRDISLNRKENIEEAAVKLYFALGFIPSPYAIYKNTFKLEPRQNMVFDLDTKGIKRWYYYKIPKYRPINDPKKLVAEGRNLLRDAVRLRMIADVPVGALLSGGLDSSATVAVMKELTDISNLHTFSIGFEGKYDETPYINTVREYFGTRHHHYYFTEQDFENLVETYSYVYDEPLSDYAGFPTYKISKIAKEHITVALSGDGGDEVFGGYPWYLMGYRMDLLKKIPRFLRIILSKTPAKKNLNGYSSLFLLKKAFSLSLYDPAFFYAKALESEIALPEIYKQWTMKKLRFCMRQTNSSMVEILRLHDLLYNTLPDNYLAKTDRASMASGLEVRSPFLDYRFVEFSQNIPVEWKVDLFKTKKLMREIVKDILPNKIVRRSKRGFTAPLQEWILSKKYDPSLRQSLEILKDLDAELYHFLNEIVLRENNKLYGTYKIRLFLFGEWVRKWIK